MQACLDKLNVRRWQGGQNASLKLLHDEGEGDNVGIGSNDERAVGLLHSERAPRGRTLVDEAEGQQESEAVDVRLFGHPLRRLCNDLWRPPAGRARKTVQLCVAEVTSQPEVGELERRDVEVASVRSELEEDVAWLDVTVDERMGVHVGKGTEETEKQLAPAADGQVVSKIGPLQNIREGAIAQLGVEDGFAVFEVDGRAVEAHDVRMLEKQERLCLQPDRPDDTHLAWFERLTCDDPWSHAGNSDFDRLDGTKGSRADVFDGAFLTALPFGQPQMQVVAGLIGGAASFEGRGVFDSLGRVGRKEEGRSTSKVDHPRANAIESHIPDVRGRSTGRTRPPTQLARKLQQVTTVLVENGSVSRQPARKGAQGNERRTQSFVELLDHDRPSGVRMRQPGRDEIGKSA